MLGREPLEGFGVVHIKEERRKAQQERGFSTMKDASQNISTLEVESVMQELVGRTEVYIYNCCVIVSVTVDARGALLRQFIYHIGAKYRPGW